MKAANCLSLIALALSLSGCFKASIEVVSGNALTSVSSGSGSGVGTDGSASTKPIYSTWSSASNGPSLDLTAYRAPATQRITFQLDNGTACECVTSSTSGGASLRLSQCRNMLGSSGELGCATFADQYTLTQANGVLSLCDSKGACNSFQ